MVIVNEMHTSNPRTLQIGWASWASTRKSILFPSLYQPRSAQADAMAVLSLAATMVGDGND
jgi:hypothetical protein